LQKIRNLLKADGQCLAKGPACAEALLESTRNPFVAVITEIDLSSLCLSRKKLNSANADCLVIRFNINRKDVPKILVPAIQNEYVPELPRPRRFALLLTFLQRPKRPTVNALSGTTFMRLVTSCSAPSERTVHAPRTSTAVNTMLRKRAPMHRTGILCRPSYSTIVTTIPAPCPAILPATVPRTCFGE